MLVISNHVSRRLELVFDRPIRAISGEVLLPRHNFQVALEGKADTATLTLTLWVLESVYSI